LYLLAVGLHGTWNAVALGIAMLSFASPGGADAGANLGAGLLLGTLGLLVLVCILALAFLIWWLRAALPDEEGTVSVESVVTESTLE
jgi:hypothetical protein